MNVLCSAFVIQSNNLLRRELGAVGRPPLWIGLKNLGSDSTILVDGTISATVPCGSLSSTTRSQGVTEFC